jgi:hypothetical protein
MKIHTCCVCVCSAYKHMNLNELASLHETRLLMTYVSLPSDRIGLCSVNALDFHLEGTGFQSLLGYRLSVV